MTPPPMKEQCHVSLCLTLPGPFYFLSLPPSHAPTPPLAVHPTESLAGHTGTVGMLNDILALSSFRVSSESPAVAFVH
jgi:hypothetical protein